MLVTLLGLLLRVGPSVHVSVVWSIVCREKLRTVRPMVDSGAPETSKLKHFKRNLKKEQLMEGMVPPRAWVLLGLFVTHAVRCHDAERFAQIEHENRLLLSKMSDIVAGKASVDCHGASGDYSHSLNREFRRRELQRITEENLVRLQCSCHTCACSYCWCARLLLCVTRAALQAMLHRIQISEPVYNRAKWEEERSAQEKLIRGMSEFKGPSSPSAGTRPITRASGRPGTSSPAEGSPS